MTAGYFSRDILKQHMAKCLPDLSVEIADEASYRPEKHHCVYRLFPYEPTNLEFLQQLYASEATIISPLATELLNSKIGLALFHRPELRNFWSDEERCTFEEFVPKTYELTNNNVGAFMQTRDRYIFKPSNSFGGRNIMIGRVASMNTRDIDAGCLMAGSHKSALNYSLGVLRYSL
jgi:hypothetical protein